MLLHKSLKSGPLKQRSGPTPNGYSKLRLPQLVGQPASVAAEGRVVSLEEAELVTMALWTISPVATADARASAVRRDTSMSKANMGLW